MADAKVATSIVQRVAPDAIRLERVLDAPPEMVWRYLTQADLRQQWFMGGTDATDGGEFELLVDHDKLSSDDVPYPDDYSCMKGRVFREKVLRFEPPLLLETTFQGGENGVVTYELLREGRRTRLVLTHSDIVSHTGFKDFGSGWTAHLWMLEEKLGGRSVRNFWDLHRRSREQVANALG